MKILRDYFNYLRLTPQGDERAPEQMVSEPTPSKWRLPLYQNSLVRHFPEIQKANRYLEKQKSRIDKCIADKDYNRALKIWIVLYQRSNSYLLYSLHRNYKTWYIKFDEVQIMNLLKKVDIIRKTWDYNAIYKRVYIPKPTGSDWNQATGVRPLGVPSFEWRLILKMINDICYLIIEPLIGDYQNGFRPHRNYVTAWKSILTKIESGYSIYEFDLKACFNRISADSIIDWFKENQIYPPFGNYIRDLIRTCPRFDYKIYDKEQYLGGADKTVVVGHCDQELVEIPRMHIIRMLSEGFSMKVPGRVVHVPTKLVFDDNLTNLPSFPLTFDYMKSFSVLNPPKNISWHGLMNSYNSLMTEKDQRVIFKFGLPQGWSLSPLLAILAIDRAFKGSNLDVTMYADDGLIFYKDKLPDVESEFSRMYRYGIELSDGFKKDGTPKCGPVSEILTFLGIRFNLRSMKFDLTEIGLGWIHYKHPKIWDFLQELMLKQGNFYSPKKSKDWTWQIHTKSWVNRCISIMSFFNFHHCVRFYLGDKSIKRFGLLFLPYSKLSTIAIQDLLRLVPKGFRTRRWFGVVPITKAALGFYSDTPELDRTIYSRKSHFNAKAWEMINYGQLIPRVDGWDGQGPIQVEDQTFLANTLIGLHVPQIYKQFLPQRPLLAQDNQLEFYNTVYSQLNVNYRYYENLYRERANTLKILWFAFISPIIELQKKVKFILNRPIYLRPRPKPKIVRDGPNWKYFICACYLPFLYLTLLLYNLTPREETPQIRFILVEDTSNAVYQVYLGYALCGICLIGLGYVMYKLFSIYSSPNSIPPMDDHTLYQGFVDNLNQIRANFHTFNVENASLIQELKSLRLQLSHSLSVNDSNVLVVEGLTRSLENKDAIITDLGNKLQSRSDTLLRLRESQHSIYTETLDSMRLRLETTITQLNNMKRTLLEQGHSIELDRLRDINDFIITCPRLLDHSSRLLELNENQLRILRQQFEETNIDFGVFLNDENFEYFGDVINILRQFILQNEYLLVYSNALTT